jgi:hypothetical protein
LLNQNAPQIPSEKESTAVNKTPNVKALTVKAPADVREKLEEWAAQNCSSMTTEFVRAVRERARREQREMVAG